ncbi:MAG: helix-turn-helix domain-containing protein [Flavobacteriaceae bacterium]|jgi:AraC-like DNA-binding protein|nr:helix-turn-helix domain-containing protein [Flavobacteriaceae bacterium]
MKIYFKITKGLRNSLERPSGYFLVFWLLFFAINSSAQSQISIENIHQKFDEAARLIDAANPEKAVALLEEIEENSRLIGYNSGITRVGYNLAIIYFNSTDYNKVIHLDDDYLEIGRQIKDYESVSHLHRLMGCAYSELGLLSKGSEEYDLALEYAGKMSPGNNKQNALSLIYSNLANYKMKSGASQAEVLNYVHKCIEEADKIQETDSANSYRKYSLIAYSYIIMANEYEKAKELDLAEDYYLRALEIHNQKTVPLVERVVLLNQLGYFYLGQKEYDKAVEYAEKGLSIERKASIPQLRRDLFEVLSKSYMELHETEKSKNYLSQFTALNDSLLNINRIAVDTALNNTISKQKELRQNNSSKQIIIYTLIGIVLLVLGIALFLYYKKQKQIKKIETALEQFKAKQIQNEKLRSPKLNKVKEVEKEKSTPIMPAEAEEKLLEKLHKFEEKQLFLERKVSLPYVAAEIETNTKYLSYIIKKHKEKDFNEYINDLRINYIIQKITDNPIYRQYKINALAEESGFSSHSKFATVFKASVGVSPSEFIKYFQQK